MPGWTSITVGGWCNRCAVACARRTPHVLCAASARPSSCVRACLCKRVCTCVWRLRVRVDARALAHPKPKSACPAVCLPPLQAPCPRSVGTTVAVKGLFKGLPVRHRVGACRGSS